MFGKSSRPPVSRHSPAGTAPGGPTEVPLHAVYIPDRPSGGGWRSPDLGCVGLAIVAALGSRPRSGAGDEIFRSKFVVGGSNSGRSCPVPIDLCQSRCKWGCDRREQGMFFSSPPMCSSDAFPAAREEDFLSSCYLCKRKLHGKDIYMYRGEKAFCSAECRNWQILSDERQHKCGPEAFKSSAAASYVSIYSTGSRKVFTPGLVAA